MTRALPVLASALALVLALAGPAKAVEGSTPPYEADLLKLAELLGGLHYLRPLCGLSAESQSWRTEMQALMDAEQPSDARRGKLIAAFNQGYGSYAQVYRTCTPAAAQAVTRQLDEGAKLAHEIVVRYGGN
ncbi:TIGR02301 family protein [Aquabacter cavernae]|uniref:TIGR02301 family protein n=1 Tax=Aquabacter cavernae TaxID=2496029 RepID=UPI000F8E9811|nr:TIGR02301 family protein [Aquabacter cavernae]